MYVLPYDVALVEKTIALFIIASNLHRVGRIDEDIMTMLPQMQIPRYVELQIHSKLYMRDMKEVVHLRETPDR